MIRRGRVASWRMGARPPLRLPDGLRMVIWPVIALEDWDVGRPMARTVIPPPQGQPMLPDVPNWSWHEYGMRVGFWRLKRMLERLGIAPTVTLNARTCESYPQVVEACLKNRWELNAHSYEQIPMHRLDDERAVIQRSVEIIAKFSGTRPRGWFGPGLTQTLTTLDHLAEAGIEYIGDWVLDDEPVTLRTTSRPVVALPYNFEIHDIVLMSGAFFADAVKASRGLAFLMSAFWICCCVKRSHSLYQGALTFVLLLAFAYCWLRTSRSQPASLWTLTMSGSRSSDMKA